MQIKGNPSGAGVPVVSPVNTVDMKIATLVPSAIAKVSPASVLLTTLRIFLKFQQIRILLPLSFARKII